MNHTTEVTRAGDRGIENNDTIETQQLPVTNQRKNKQHTQKEEGRESNGRTVLRCGCIQQLFELHESFHLHGWAAEPLILSKVVLAVRTKEITKASSMLNEPGSGHFGRSLSFSSWMRNSSAA